MGVTFVFDGITVDHARELLTDDPVIADIGHRCTYPYLASLADVAVGLVSGTKLSTTAMTPGQWIKNTFDNKFDPIEVIGKLTPEDMLEQGSQYRTEVENHIRLLARLNTHQYRAWKELIVREAREFLGDDQRIFEDLPDPDEYIFGKKLTYDRQLQNLVPERCITNMHDALYPIEGTPPYLVKVHAKTVRELITRTVTAHILIFCWYRYMTAKSFLASGCLRWPHCTRATLIECGSEGLLSRKSKTLKGTPHPRSLYMVREVLMPNILTPILIKASGERDPLKVITYNLQDLVSGKRYETERQLVEEVMLPGESTLPIGGVKSISTKWRNPTDAC